MNAREIRRESTHLADLFGPEGVADIVARRARIDPEIKQKRQTYAEQANDIARKLMFASLSPSQRQRLQWNRAVLQHRADHGPVVHEGYYDFNFLPDRLSETNPQLKKITGVVTVVTGEV